MLCCLLLIGSGSMAAAKGLYRDQTKTEYRETEQMADAGALYNTEMETEALDVVPEWEIESLDMTEHMTEDAGTDDLDSQDAVGQVAKTEESRKTSGQEEDVTEISPTETEQLQELPAGSEFLDPGVAAVNLEHGNGQTAVYENGYIFMGDSRIYLLNQQCHLNEKPNFFVVCCPGMGYSWMVSEALPRVKNIQRSHPEIKHWVLISAMGVNDLKNVRYYVQRYEKLSQKIDLRLLSVNPTAAGANAGYENAKVEAFNRKLQKIQGVRYIDSYRYLKNLGFATEPDGVHYDAASNWAIYAYVLEQLYRDEGGTSVQEIDCEARAKILETKLNREIVEKKEDTQQGTDR